MYVGREVDGVVKKMAIIGSFPSRTNTSQSTVACFSFPYGLGKMSLTAS
jgi:hypothetical protein